MGGKDLEGLCFRWEGSSSIVCRRVYQILREGMGRKVYQLSIVCKMDGIVHQVLCLEVGGRFHQVLCLEVGGRFHLV